MHTYFDQFKTQLSLQKLHHTYIIVGPASQSEQTVRDEVVRFLRTGFDLPQSYPDMWIKEYDSVGVDDAEEIADVHLRRSIGENKKFIVFQTSQITQQAQNSLLKLLEEPAPGTHFFIVIPSVTMLLPTILSRAHVIIIEQDGQAVSADQKAQQATIQRFVTESAPERLSIIGGLLADYDKEKIGREDIYAFVHGVEHTVHEKVIKNSSKTHIQDALQVLAHVQTYIRDTSSSLKLLLEYLALRLPSL